MKKLQLLSKEMNTKLVTISDLKKFDDMIKPFEVMSNGLDNILKSLKEDNMVTVS